MTDEHNIHRPMSALSRAVRNPWLLAFIGIPFLAITWVLAYLVLPIGQNYYVVFGAAVVAGIVGNGLLLGALYRGNRSARLLAVVCLLVNWPIAVDWMKVEPWRPRVVSYPIPPPRISVITAQPAFHPGGSLKLMMADSSQTVGISRRGIPVGLLDPQKIYQFTIEETPEPSLFLQEGSLNDGAIIMKTGHRDRPRPPDFHWSAEAMRITDGGTVIFYRSTCEIHRQKMERRDARIIYGLPSSDAFPDRKAEAELFPHYRDFELGGCAVMPGFPETTTQFVCGACEEAFSKWQAEHPWTAK